jgi:hypothetical protein
MVQKAGIQILNRKQILWTLKKIKDLFGRRNGANQLLGVTIARKVLPLWRMN